MQFSTLFVSTLLFAGSAFAQKGQKGQKGGESGASNSTSQSSQSSQTSGESSQTSASGQETVHVIQVGQNQSLTFSPNNIKANVGDLVQFQFWPKNHSVVQSTFGQPCVPIESVMTNITNAFYSGYMPTNRTTSGQGSNTLTYTIRVTSQAPLWFYCGQAKHCQSGMVGAINAATSGEKTVQAFAALAAQAPQNLSPGQAATGGATTGGNGTATNSGENSGANNGGTTNNNGGESSTLATASIGAGATAAASGGTTAATANASPGKLLDSAKTGMVGVAAVAGAFFLL